MTKVILQPAGDDDSQIHFKDTVINFINIEDILQYISTDEEIQLRNIYPSGQFKVWGITKGKGNGKISSWKRVSKGDIVLFAKNKRVFCSATVTVKFQNAGLAAALWGFDDDNFTWEYLYFLDELEVQNISREELNSVIPLGNPKNKKFYKLNKNIQGFQVLSDVQSEHVLAAFNDLESGNYFQEVDKAPGGDETSNYLNGLENTDKDRLTKVRLEQAALKKFLFKGKNIGSCGICHHSYPVAILTAAHIKKRSACTHVERINVKIVMPMCRMGCDELYERGYISVKDGKVVGLKQERTTPAIEKAKAAVIGNQCTYYTTKTIEYFEWHFGFHGGNKP